MSTILGAGGDLANELVAALAGRGEPIRLVGRTPKLRPGASETVQADLSDLEATVRAVAGSRVVFLVAGLKYDVRVWQELWPRIMRNTIEAAKRAGARLVFFDNVYMYGRVDGAMTEETPFRPISRKGEIRAAVATLLLEEMKAGAITALIARSADFYGPGARNGVPNVLVVDRLARGQPALWPVQVATRHSLTFTPDAARALVLLAERADAWNQTWHLPTAPDPPTGRDFIELAARALNVSPRYRVLSRSMMWVGGWFDRTVRETREMLYQYEHDYIFDSTKFARAFGSLATPYAEGIHQCAVASVQAAHGP